MFKPFLGRRLIGAKERANLDRVALSQNLFRYNTPEGSFCEKTEREVARILEVKHALVITNGTNALKCALMAFSPQPGEYVLIPSVSFIATANACLTVGLIPIMVDVDESGHMDPYLIADFLKKHPPPFAVIAVHLDGSGCQIEAIAEICRSYHIPLIEDTARAFGVCRRKKALGTFGDIGCFSFQENKLLSTGEGGALVTNQTDLFSKLKAYADHGVSRASDGTPRWNRDLGFGENFKAHELTAAVLLAQLHKLDYIRAQVCLHYLKLSECIAKEEFFPRHEEDIPTTVWIDSPTLIKSLKQKGAPLTSWQSLFLPDHPIIKEKRSLYRDGYPWNLLKFNYLSSCDKGRKICSVRHNFPVPILEDDFHTLRSYFETVHCMHP